MTITDGTERLPEHVPRLGWTKLAPVPTQLVPGHHTPGA
jgi:hypothetical protein